MLIKKLKNKITLLLLFGTIIFSACATSQPKISIELMDFDFGEVVNGTIMSKEITISNLGNAPLIIESISTSCGCTTASLETMIIAPTESSTLTIEFDSGAHGPELTGVLIRQIFVVSNDPDSLESEIVFSSNIILAENTN